MNFLWTGKYENFLTYLCQFSKTIELVNIFYFSSANATPEFEGRGGEELALELSDTLANAYESPLAFDLKPLCILPGQQCWKLYVDILVSI